MDKRKRYINFKKFWESTFFYFLFSRNFEKISVKIEENLEKIVEKLNGYFPASKVLLFFETFLCATGSTESSGETRTTSCYCLCSFLCCSSTTVVLLCAVVLAALQATFVLLKRFLFGYSSICFPVLLLLTCLLPTQITWPNILSNNYHCVGNSCMRFPLLTVALTFFAGWV